MRRLLLVAAVIFALAGLCNSEAKAQYPYAPAPGNYSGMTMNLGMGNYYRFGSTPYGSYSGMSMNMGGGGRYSFGSGPMGSYNGMQLNMGGGNYYNSQTFTPNRRAYSPWGYGFGAGY